MNDIAPFPLHVQDLREQLLEHPLYDAIASEGEPALRLFMRSHVFCVWDFQSLLTALQLRLTGVRLPWLPTGDPHARRLINEVVLEEESDEHPDGGYASHFEVYLEAMQEAGADRAPVLGLMQRLPRGEDLEQALAADPLPTGVAEFVGNTLQVARDGDLAALVAVFTHSREDIIPDLFRGLVAGLAARDPSRWRKLAWYLNRHIEMDGERHGPLSHTLLQRVCGDDPGLREQAELAARAALKARIALWDGILADIARTSTTGEPKPA
jgi:hypothetical protein